MKLILHGSAERLHRFVFVALFYIAATAAGHAATPAVSAGHDVTAALAADGTIRTWGSDAYGQLGLGRVFSTASPTAVNGITNVKAVSAGFDHTLALTTDGRVWSWGANEYGQLGDGTPTSRSNATVISGISGVVAIEAGLGFSYALTQDGAVWRLNFNPVKMTTLANVVAISGGGASGNAKANMAAVRSDGTVWTWFNSYGALGTGWDSVGASRPVQVAGISSAIGISCLWDSGSGVSFIAVKSDGTVWTWGANSSGQLGDGTTLDRATPTLVPNLTSIVTAGGKNGFAFALKNDGTLYAWGANDNGQLGEGTVTQRLVPKVIMNTVARFSAGLAHAVAQKVDGSFWAWGNNVWGQCGDDDRSSRVLPKYVSRFLDGITVSAGGYHTAVVTSAATIQSVGQNTKGQLGDGATISRPVPTVVPGISNITAVAQTWFSTLALRSDGQVLAWGGSTIPSPTLIAGVSNAIAVAGGYSDAIVLRNDGTVLTLRIAPTATGSVVPGISGVTAISMNRETRLALKADGTVWAWGTNESGQLGDGTTIDHAAPAQVVGLPDVVAIAAGFQHNLAVKRDGTVWAWGDNTTGQIGDGTTTNRLVPVQVTGLNGVTAVSAGWFTSMALKSDGTVAIWGSVNNGFRALGDGTTNASRVPKTVPGVSNIASISASWGDFGNTLSFALKNDGTVLGWGANNLGQLGDGTLATRLSPVVVLREGGAGAIATNDWFLDLNPAIQKIIADDKTPIFKTVATPVGSNLTANIQYRAADVGTTASTFVFALAPANLVKGAQLKGGAGVDDPAYHINLKATPAPGVVVDPKDGPLGCVLAQLNSAGQLTAVSASNLQAYVTGVLSAGGTAVNVLNNISAAAIQGSTFYVGYGTTGTSMINNGVNRSVASIPGTQTCQPQGPQTGWWWDPVQRDRGYGIEVRGNNLYYVSFMNNPTGTPSWMVASGPTALDGSLFQASLYSYANGQTLTGALRAPTGPTSEGLITISTATATQSTLIAPAGTRSITRMEFIPNGLSTTPQTSQPESGWWWNKDEPGRGYFIEWQNGYANVTGYMYDEAGKPIWYQSMAPSTDPKAFSGTFNIFGSGYPLTQMGSTINRKIARLTDNFQSLSIRFSDAANGTLTLPGGRNIAITRLRF